MFMIKDDSFLYLFIKNILLVKLGFCSDFIEFVNNIFGGKIFYFKLIVLF